MLQFSKYKSLKWKIIGEDVGAYPFPTYCLASVIAKTKIPIIGKRMMHFLFIYENEVVTGCIISGEILKIGKKVFKKIITFLF